jgi:hypothetical protein
MGPGGGPRSFDVLLERIDDATEDGDVRRARALLTKARRQASGPIESALLDIRLAFLPDTACPRISLYVRSNACARVV